MSTTFQIVDSNGNIIEASTDGQALFAKLAGFNVGGDKGFRVRRAPNGLPEIPVREAPCLPAATALAFWIEVDGERVRQTPNGLYRRAKDGKLWTGDNVLGNAPTIGLAEQMIATFEQAPNANDVSTEIGTARIVTETGSKNSLPGATLVPTVTNTIVVPDRVIVPGQTIDPVAAARIKATEAILTASGIARPEQWFASGTDMLDCGQETFQTIARTYDSQEPFVDMANNAIAYVIGQKRRDYVIEPKHVTQIRFEDGWLRVPGRAPMRVTFSGLRALMGKLSEVFPSSGAWASVMGKAALEAALNDGFDRWGRIGKDQSFMLRVRDSLAGEPLLWAVAGPQFPGRRNDADAILRAMLAQVNGDRRVKGEVTIDPDTSRLVARAVWMDRSIKKAAVGDIFQATLVATSRDDAKGAFEGHGGITAVRCINCSLAETEIGGGRGVHRGDNVTKAVASAFGNFHNATGALLQHWGFLNEKSAEITLKAKNADGEPKKLTTPVEIADYWVKNVIADDFKAAGINADNGRDMLIGAWTAEEKEGRQVNDGAAVIRALAKMAQDKRLDAFQRVEMERASGRLVPIVAKHIAEAAA